MRAARLGLGQQAVHRVREGRRLILDEDVAPGDRIDPFGAQRGRDNGLPHGHGLDDLEAGAAAQAQRHDHGRGRRKMRPQVRHEAGQLDPGPGQRLERRRRPAADDLEASVGVRLGDAGPDILHEMDHGIDIGNGREEPEIDHGSPVRRRVRGARLVVLDVCGVGNDRRADAGRLVEQAPFIRRAAQVDAVGVAVGPQLLPPQLAPVGPGIKATAHVAAGAGELPRQVIGDLVRVHDQGWQLLAGRSLAQVVVAKIRELQVDDVESPGAQDPVKALLQRWQRDTQPLEAPDRGQGPELQQPFGEAFPTAGVRDHHHFAAVGLHGPAALVGVKLVVDQHRGRQVVASRQLGHKPMDPRLGAKARRAGRHLGNVEDIKAFWAHRRENLRRAPNGRFSGKRGCGGTNG